MHLSFTLRLVGVCFLVSLLQLVNLSAQCGDSSNYWEESWVSCVEELSPNPTRGNSYWLLYDFSEPQAISTTWIWNANRPNESGLGAKEVYLDISVDGINWISVNTDAYVWDQAPETEDYQGFEGPNLETFGFIKKILFTIVSNHDNSNCKSIAEVKFNINPNACYGVEDECGVCDGPGMIDFYQDADADGLGNARVSVKACTPPEGYVDNSNDPCDSGLYGWADMQVLFEENGCTGCHSNPGLSGLDLTSFDGFSAGGNICGNNIIVGTTLVDIITINNYNGCTSPIAFPSMNERVGGALDTEELTMIQDWINVGAPYDCMCPPGSQDSDNDGVCDASDNCPGFDDNLIGTSCDDNNVCTVNDVYTNNCNCEGNLIPDSDFDGVCDTQDAMPNDPCTADGIYGLPEPQDWVSSESNDCDQDGISVAIGDIDDYDVCIDDEGTSLAPACSCPGTSLEAGGTYFNDVGIWETSGYYAQGLPDGNLSGGIGWQDYLELSFPYMEIGQEICFDLGFEKGETGVKFEINELGSYKFFNPDTTMIDFVIQQYCFPVFDPGEQLIRITRLASGSVKIDGARYAHCPCNESDPEYDFASCQCPNDFSTGPGTLTFSEGFNNPENADGEPDGIFTGWINGDTDSLEISFPELPINTDICVVIGFENVAAKVSFELNGAFYEEANVLGTTERYEGQEFCFKTTSTSAQILKIKDDGSGSIYVDGSFYKICNECVADEDNDTVCDDIDACPGYNDLLDIDADGIPDGCDNCDNNLVGTSCDDNDPCTINDLFDANCNCAGTFNDINGDGICDPESLSMFVHVDQFGYHVNASKVAVFSNPQIGFNSEDTYTPTGIVELRRSNDHAVILSGAPVAWNGGATHDQSGDQGWWFDFSTHEEEGLYYVIDPGNGHRSGDFMISCNPYDDVITAASRMYYYNRCNMEKDATYAGAKWTDGVSFMGDTQDGNARYINDPENVELERDLSGGWFDAGDFNKYVTFAYMPVDQLLWAYTENPQAFTDDTNIPESGNGIPDIIDELIWELDWLLKMTNADGSTIIKMGNIDYGTNDQSPPSINTGTRYYGPTCTSASAALAANLSHAAVVLRKFPAHQEYAITLKQAAENAFNYVLPRINNGTLETDCDDQTIKSGDADWAEEDQIEAAIVAAVYLFELTNDVVYKDFLNTYVVNHEPISINWWGPYKMPVNDALLHYSELAQADANLANTIINSATATAGNNTFGFNDNDLYRAYMPDWGYHWGSNQVKAGFATLNSMLIDYNINPINHDDYQYMMKEQLHYFHGVNPLNMVYLSNMYEYGAERSANEIYHNWFTENSIYDNALTSSSGPAPGYVTGGANSSFSVATIAPPSEQPHQKSYLDFNNGYPDASWEVTEPAIYYQAAYLRLLSNVMGKEESTCAPCPSAGQSCDDGFSFTI